MSNDVLMTYNFHNIGKHLKCSKRILFPRGYMQGDSVFDWSNRIYGDTTVFLSHAPEIYLALKPKEVIEVKLVIRHEEQVEFILRDFYGVLRYFNRGRTRSFGVVPHNVSLQHPVQAVNIPIHLN